MAQTWKAVADGILVEWDGKIPNRDNSKIVLPKAVKFYEEQLELKVIAVGSVAASDVKVDDVVITLVEALKPVKGNVFRMSAGLILGIIREEKL